MLPEVPYTVNQIQDRRDALEKQIAPALWRQLTDLISDEVTTYEWRLAAVLAAHLPGMAPTIFALTTHAIDDDPEGGCCGLPRQSYGRPE